MGVLRPLHDEPRPSNPRPEPIRLVPSFDDFYRNEYRAVVGLAFVLTGNHSVAEDLAQQAFTAAHQSWDRIGDYDDPGAWVRRVMINRSTSRFRRLASEAKALTRLRGRRLDPVAPNERSLEVWEAVRTLPRRQAQAVTLRYWEDLNIEQIAEVLGCSTETVKTHLKRGRSALSERLDGTEVTG